LTLVFLMGDDGLKEVSIRELHRRRRFFLLV
jgi:hypothetical protein